MNRPFCILGPAAALVAWLVIGVSWAVNSDWFVFTEHAFSDLGGVKARMPWIYNYGLILVGLLVTLYSLCPYRAAVERLEAFGSGLLLTAGLFLALIGVYPAGTRPHVFVSTWFFLQMDMALVALSLGAYRACRNLANMAALALSLAAFPVYILIGITLGWPSAAVAEAYGIVVIDIVVIILTLDYLRRRV
ncbi:conserved hypothetical protein [Aeropyrum pernix K1]|uniref:DUF998 domain-containing protein n=1 Tax=Aeropyrum pernix (strain ATCC 700893 / DSM 11879 / JCM 9820 / NBRC 100138 / K1) TaxID=272557 RepID=Q9Y8U9_AERPE|nr:DUF998 domain-containing protein [Aeropyrum pernix]BAA81551.2 conserved hypothetical protein [Aeropyrum pernix K1]